MLLTIRRRWTSELHRCGPRPYYALVPLHRDYSSPSKSGRTMILLLLAFAHSFFYMDADRQ